MAVPSNNASPTATVPITYLGCIGKPTPEAYPFDIDEQAPQFLCTRHCFGPDHNADAAGQYLTSLVQRHNTKFLLSRAWRCQVCDQPARELYHSAIPGLVRPGFRPWVWDTIVPICRSGGACDVQAEKWAVAFGKEGFPMLEVGRKCCELCGKVTGVKLCRGCRVLA